MFVSGFKIFQEVRPNLHVAWNVTPIELTCTKVPKTQVNDKLGDANGSQLAVK